MTFSAKSPLRRLPLRELILLLLLSAGAFFMIFQELEPNGCRIFDSVTIGSLEVGGMTRREARAALNNALEDTLYSEDFTLILPEETLSLTSEGLRPRVNVRKAVDAAYAHGRKEDAPSEISLLPYLEIQEGYLRQQLKAYSVRYDTDLVQPSWQLVGQMPELASDKMDPDAPTQVLLVTKGIPERYVDLSQAQDAVLQACAQCLTSPLSARVEAVTKSMPNAPDLQGLWEELTIAPVDDSLSFVTYQPVAGSWGYSFDLRSAEYRLTKAAWGETVEIPLEYQRPEILGEEVYFRDVLGWCDSPHTTTKDRNINLQRVCELLDGHIIQPGEEFSYNAVIGERTVERGFRPGLTYSGTRIVKTIGGGVCQGSSALNVCVLYADLEIVERVSHGFVVAYVPIGQDAAVSWSTNTDYRFRNSTNFPIMVKAEMADGFMKIKLLGTDEKDYYVELKSTRGEDSSLIYSNCYKLKYDKETNELLSKEFSIRSTYMHR